MKCYTKTVSILIIAYAVIPPGIALSIKPPSSASIVLLSYLVVITVSLTVYLYLSMKATYARIKQLEEEMENYRRASIDLSKMAGIAENSTGVLHNIGNILNSVNIAASLVAEKYKSIRVSGLYQVAEMLEKHREDIQRFITTDPQGRLLPEYLQKVSQEISEDQDFICAELTGLTKNIEHIKQIVSVQQSYSRRTGFTEKLFIRQVLDDAIGMSIDAIDKNRILVRKHYNSDGIIEIDKNKIMQIIINLVQNACQSLQDCLQKEKIIIMELSEEKDSIFIKVSDNGLGIEPEHFDRLFEHGFTTKKNGNGFGLHSSRLLVEEMGGTLEVFSDGPDTGATFVLRLPMPIEESTGSAEHKTDGNASRQ